MNRQKISIEHILSCLQRSPLRMTRKRERLLGALLTFDRPVSATELCERAGLVESDLVTVYRTIEAFAGIGIIQGIPLESGGTIYELTEPNDHHHHFVCRQCHKTERLDLCFAEELEKQAAQIGFSDIRHVMEVYGRCGDCQESK